MITRKNILIMLIGLILLLVACGREVSKNETIEEEAAATSMVNNSLEEEELEIVYDEEFSIYNIKTKLKATEAMVLEEAGKIKLINIKDSLTYDIDLATPSIGKPVSSSTAVFNSKKATDYTAISKGYVYFAKDKDVYRVFHQYNGIDKEIGKLQTSTEELQNSYIFSEDKSKLAFIEDNSIIVYSFNNEKLVRLPEATIDALKKDFSRKVFFSPQAGYVTLLIENENGAVGFKGFGADSGKLLHDTIYGITPVWSHNELYVSFLHKNSQTPLEKLVVNGEEKLVSDKIAMLNRKTKKITFFTEFDRGTYIIGEPIWSIDDSGIIFTTGSEKIADIHLYRLKGGDIISLAEDGINDGSFNELSNIQLVGNQIIYSLNNPQEKNLLKLVDLGGGGATVIEDVIPVRYSSTDEEGEKIYSILDNCIVYVKGDSVYKVEGSTTTALIKNSHPLDRLQYLEKSGVLATYVINEGALELILVRIQ